MDTKGWYLSTNRLRINFSALMINIYRFLFPTSLRAKLAANPEPKALWGRLHIITGRKQTCPQSQHQSHVLCCRSTQTFPPLATEHSRHNTAFCSLHSPSSQKEAAGYFKTVTWADLLGKAPPAAFWRNPNCTPAATLFHKFSPRKRTMFL